MEQDGESKEFILIKTTFEKDQDFKKYYVTGAIGGFKNKYDFRLSFYNMETNDLIMKS